MKVSIAYESKYGNGKKCVDYLQNAITKKGHDVTTFSVREQDPKSLPNADLYIFSSPTQVGGPAGKMKKFLKNMPIYPINCLVKLNDKRVAKVVKANENPFRPIVDIVEGGKFERIDLTEDPNLGKYIIGVKK